ncbi:MAG: cobalamin-binding protein [Chloroflexi bacterium]|nr:cobalamin-binding protein [Chloroflexota bacterium]MCI0819627.1 cobalamin-binding protein [Chloroflexota bacterium]MCI0884070.1 cobalamin-binding protein [Chloroflexota bacterium]
MKIWSLLPSATEILFALGLADDVTGVTHECDYPPTAASKPQVTVSYIDSSLSSREIDEQVASRLKEGHQLYGIDRERLLADPPDVIVTQDLCPVCAVSPSDFAGYLEEAGCKTRLVTLNPNTLNDVIESVGVVGEALGRRTEAAVLMSSLRSRLDAVREAVEGAPPKPVLTLEWLDPLMPGGHWIPEMIRIAGGESGVIAAGEPSRKVPWEELRREEPDVIILMPCGFSPERADREASVLWQLDGWSELAAVRAAAVYCVDGNQRYSRPGPRLVDGAEELARILHPELRTEPAAEGAVRKLTSAQNGVPSFAAYR